MSETLDIEDHGALLRYLLDTGRLQPGERPAIRTLAGGVSNRTVLVGRQSGESWVLKQALATLRVAVEWHSSPERIRREALGLRWLEKLAPAGTITPLVFEDYSQYLLAMQAVPQPHDNWKILLLAGRLEQEHVEQFGLLLGAIHRRGWERRDEIAPVFEERTFFESLRVEPYYSYSASRVPRAAPFLEALIEETRACRLTLVHGDYSPKNILVYRGRLILLDHEVIHFGDPAFDLGFSLTHLLSKAHHLPDLRRELAAAAVLYWRTYLEALEDVPWRAALEPRAVRHTLGCLLARVAGRSTLEYLDAEERDRQRTVVLSLMADAPPAVPDLVDAFVTEL